MDLPRTMQRSEDALPREWPGIGVIAGLLLPGYSFPMT